jgi:iron-sulfur cluster assembly protein
MITVTPAAATQIRQAAEQSNAQGLCLRIAARIEPDGAIEYGMGFDEKNDDDMHLVSEGIDLLIAPASKDIFMGAVLDFVELSPGDNQFIFINPNDPSHNTPATDKK